MESDYNRRLVQENTLFLLWVPEVEIHTKLLPGFCCPNQGRLFTFITAMLHLPTLHIDSAIFADMTNVFH